MGKAVGRKTKLTPELQDKLCMLLQTGNYFDAACGACGITDRTGYYWMERGESETSGIYFQFFHAVKKAQAEAESVAVIQIRKASEDTWQAAAWWLERRFPDKWGRRMQQVEHSGGEIPLKIVIEYENNIDDNE